MNYGPQLVMITMSQARRYMPVIPALSRLRLPDHKFEASLGCIVRP
jgi:hypothetical protein